MLFSPTKEKPQKEKPPEEHPPKEEPPKEEPPKEKPPKELAQASPVDSPAPAGSPRDALKSAQGCGLQATL